MVAAFHRPLLAYLAQEHRAGPVAAAYDRRVYRWRSHWRERLHIFPSFSLEFLGLVHLHVFVAAAGEAWMGCPYAVEAVWVTPDLCRDVLYLHCLVPVHQRAAVERRLRAWRAQTGASVRLLWSGSPWQRLGPGALPTETLGAKPIDRVLTRYPLVLPVICETWRAPWSLPRAWERIRHHLGETLQSYLRQRRLRLVNGKGHVKTALLALSDAGLFRQRIIRYQPFLHAGVEVFVELHLDLAHVQAFLDRLAHCTYATESYQTACGYLVRLLGSHALVDELMMGEQRSAARCVYWHNKHRAPPHVRFHYETLFHPKRGWQLPEHP